LSWFLLIPYPYQFYHVQVVSLSYLVSIKLISTKLTSINLISITICPYRLHAFARWCMLGGSIDSIGSGGWLCALGYSVANVVFCPVCMVR
jgi:hypothetical protein